MFARLLPTGISKRIASFLAGIFLVLTYFSVPINAAVYPGDPGAGVSPGTYGSYNYSFCYYNNNDDLECFDSVNPQIGITKIISDTTKFRLVSPTNNGAIVPYRITLTNNSNPSRTISTFYIREYLPDAVSSIETPRVIGGTASNTGTITTTNNNTSITWTGTMEPSQTIIIEFNATVASDLNPFIGQPQTNVACVSNEPIVDGNTAVLCSSVNFEVTSATQPQTADLLLNKTVTGSNSFKPGDRISYSFTVTNVGGVNVTTFRINENNAVDSRSSWPTTYLGNITNATASSGSASVANNVITVTGVNLAPGQSMTVTAEAQVRPEIGALGLNFVAQNRACVQAENDTNPANDCATFNTAILVDPVSNPQMGIEKQIRNNGQRSILVSEGGRTIPYQITVTNTTSPARNINEFFVTDILPPALTGTISNVRVVSGDGTVTQIGTTPDIRWNGTLPFGSQVVIGFDATLLADLSNFTNSTQRNIACVQLTANGRSEACHYDDFVITSDRIPSELDLELFKGERNDLTGFREGETVTYEFIVTNNSNVPLRTFVIRDLSLPNTYLNEFTSVSLKSGDPGEVHFTIIVDGNPNDPINTGVVGFIWQGGDSTIEYGETITIYATTTVKTNLNLTQTVPVLNRACVEAAGDPSTGPRGGNNCHDFTVNIMPGDTPPSQRALGVQKEVLGPNIAYKGQTTEMRYRLLISNNSTQPITPTQTIPIVITEDLPNAATTPLTNITTSYGTATLQADGRTIHWYGATIPVGGQVNIDFTVPLGNLANVPGNGIQRNVATVRYNNEESQDDAEFTVENEPETTGVDLHLEKTADSIVVGVGDTINYRFTITNTKGIPFNGTVTIDESQWPSTLVSNIQTVSGGATLNGNTITWNGSIAAGQSVDIIATARATAVGQATNVASISTEGDDNPENNTDRTTVTIITRIPDNNNRGIGIQKIVVGDSSIARGRDTQVEYRITVGNATGENVTSFTIIEEQWPAVFSSINNVTATRGNATLAANGRDINWTGGATDFTPGSHIDISFRGILRDNLTAADETVQRNLASVIFKGVVNKDDAEFTITPPGGNPQMDLAIQKAADSEDIIVSPGETVNYTYTVTNNSAQQFSGSFRISEQWPTQYLNDINSVNAEFGTATRQGNDIIWTGSIAPGAQLKILITATAKNVPGRATNIATIRNPDGTPWVDSVPGNNSDQTTVTIIAAPGGDPITNVEKIIEGNLQSVAPGASVTFTARFTNTSQRTVSRVTITERETNFTINTITPINNGSITGASPTYTWTGNLPSGQTLVIRITGTVANAVGQNMQNQITFSDPRDPNNEVITDPNTGNNTATTPPVPIQADPIDNVTKIVDGNPSSVLTGANISFTATVTNRSGRTVTRYTITEQPTNFRINTITASTGTISGSGPYTWTGSLPNGQTLTVRITGTVTGPAGSNVVNVITFSDARDSNNNQIPDNDTRDNTGQTPSVPIRAAGGGTPITGGTVAVVTGVLGAASLAGVGYLFLKKRGFKLRK